MQIFDRKFHLIQQTRASKAFHQHTFIHQEVCDNIHDRLLILNKKFSNVLIFGHITEELKQIINSSNIIHHTPFNNDDEELLPTFAHTFDLIISNLTLHYANNIPQILVKYHSLLDKDGLFIGTMFGGKTCIELRLALQIAELQLTSGVSPRVIPMVDLKDAAHLIQKAGFHVPVADIDNITVYYNNLKSLLSDIKGMGQSNALAARNIKIPSKKFFAEVEHAYKTEFAHEDKLPATFEIITITGIK